VGIVSLLELPRMRALQLEQDPLNTTGGGGTRTKGDPIEKDILPTPRRSGQRDTKNNNKTLTLQPHTIEL
jgi:hypothetical protein